MYSNPTSGKASIEPIDVYQMETDEFTFNWGGPKVLPVNETDGTYIRYLGTLPTIQLSICQALDISSIFEQTK